MRPESAKRRRARKQADQREYRQQVLREALGLIDELPESQRRDAVMKDLGQLIDAKDLVLPVRRPRAKKIPSTMPVALRTASPPSARTNSVVAIVRREAQYRFP